VRSVAILAAVLLASCSSLLGIQDPSPAGDGGIGSDGGDGGTPTLDHLAFNVGDVRLALGQRARLHVQAVFSNSTTQDATTTAMYTTENAGVVTVSAGVLTAQAPGSATVTARMGSARPATVAVMVTGAVCHPVINEVLAEGGSPADEWVEIYNPCVSPIPVGNWTLVYRGANVTGATDSTLLVTLAGEMASGEVRLYANAPYPGADGTWTGVNGQIGGTSGALGLRDGPKDTGTLIDAIAYGMVTAGHPFIETRAAPAMVNGHSAARLPFDGKDDDDGAADFAIVAAPTPRALNAP
jgi:hypothetical protein